MLPANRNSSCNTTPSLTAVALQGNRGQVVAVDADGAGIGYQERGRQAGDGVLPDPEVPTRAVMVPAGASRLTLVQHRVTDFIAKRDAVEADVAAHPLQATVRLASAPSGCFASTSCMRSRPANASVISVPMRLICTIGRS